MLEEETDFVRFMQKFRLLEKKVDLKISNTLNLQEKKYVENNRFPKIQLAKGEDTSSSDDEKNNSKYSPIKPQGSL